MYTLRPFADHDYAAVVAAYNAAMPGYVDTVDDWKHWDAHTPAYCVRVRLVAEEAGRVIAAGHFYQAAWAYHPHMFHISVSVRPEHQRQGVGGRLYDALMAHMDAHNPVAVRASAREDQQGSVRFILSRGFTEEMRVWESRLDLATFDARPYAGFRPKSLALGITITTLRELMDADPDHMGKLYEARNALMADVPSTEPFTPTSYEEWSRSFLSDKNLMPDGQFLALHQGEIVALSQLWRSGEPDVLYTGLTATRRDYRRLGLALALKLRAIAYAQAEGYREVRTGNESNNRPMLSINEALGFVKQPAWVEYVKQL